MKIERPYCLNIFETKNTQLHIFSDASQQAYAAAAYIRVEVKDKVSAKLVMAKARVTPLKGLTIPRAELQAAVLASRLAKIIIKEHRIQFNSTTFWIDAEIVLNWLKSNARRHLTFISHRIGEILESTNIEQWRWVPSKKNVADEATRDNYDSNLTSSSRWFQVPDFLKLSEKFWPVKQEDKLH